MGAGLLTRSVEQNEGKVMGSNSWDQVVKGCDLRFAGPRAFLACFGEQAAALKRPMWQGMEGSFWLTAPEGPDPANNHRASLGQTLPLNLEMMAAPANSSIVASQVTLNRGPRETAP